MTPEAGARIMGETEPESRTHVVCPFCSHRESVSDLPGIYEIEDQRSYDNVCAGCGRQYDVVVVIDRTYVSPAKGERAPK